MMFRYIGKKSARSDFEKLLIVAGPLLAAYQRANI